MITALLQGILFIAVAGLLLPPVLYAYHRYLNYFIELDWALMEDEGEQNGNDIKR